MENRGKEGEDIFDMGKLSAYCYMVERGKPAAVIPIKSTKVDESVEFIKKISCLNLHVEELNDEWKSLWVYKYPHVLEIIKTVPKAPKTVFDHWVLGKLFGYEEGTIKEFLDSISIE